MSDNEDYGQGTIWDNCMNDRYWFNQYKPVVSKDGLHLLCPDCGQVVGSAGEVGVIQELPSGDDRGDGDEDCETCGNEI
jgi:hypothetical protein